MLLSSDHNMFCHAHVQIILDHGIVAVIIKTVMKRPEEEHLEVWTADSFKIQAIGVYYAVSGLPMMMSCSSVMCT